MHNTSSKGEILHLHVWIYKFWRTETEQQFIMLGVYFHENSE